MSIQHNVGIAAFIAIALFPRTALAITPTLTINGSANANVASCSVNLTVRGTVIGTYYGTFTYNWTLYRDASAIKTASQTITCEKDTPGICEPVFFSYSAPPVNGAYTLTLKVLFTKGTSNAINVTASGSPTSKPRINGNAADVVEVCPGGPITLDGSQSTCASSYFASIELSDKWWNRKGGEFNQWLASSQFSKYGPISAFDVKRWAEDSSFRFVPGQYYRVKLAVGPGWHEKAQLIFIKTPISVLKINGQSALTLDILKPNYPIIMDASASTCAGGLHFLSVQLSDANWNGLGPEAMRWLKITDFLKYGLPSQFNVKRFAEDQWFIFSPGQYYRVKLAVGPGWNDTTTLIYIKP